MDLPSVCALWSRAGEEGWEVSGGPDAKRLEYHETGLAPGHAPPLAPMEDTVRR